MSEHTPGPLTVRGPSLGLGPNDDGGDYAVIDSKGKVIAEFIYLVGPGRDTRPALENARLFAAAPGVIVDAERSRERWKARAELLQRDLAEMTRQRDQLRSAANYGPWVWRIPIPGKEDECTGS